MPQYVVYEDWTVVVVRGVRLRSGALQSHACLALGCCGLLWAHMPGDLCRHGGNSLSGPWLSGHSGRGT